jgi:hypothetical protein
MDQEQTQEMYQDLLNWADAQLELAIVTIVSFADVDQSVSEFTKNRVAYAQLYLEEARRIECSKVLSQKPRVPLLDATRSVQ